MSIETLATQERSRLHGGLAAIATNALRKMRDEGLRECFHRMEDSAFRMEFVARIHGKIFINDAAARSVNATWYTLENTEGSIIWIADGSDTPVDYTLLRPVAFQKVDMLICVGGDSGQLRKCFRGIVPTIKEVGTLAEAVNCACYAPIEAVKVIYSPATEGALTIEEAGRRYRHEVNEL